MPVFALLLLAIAAEIATVIVVGQAVGALVTILLLVAVSMAGIALLRRQGTRTITAFSEALRNRRDPSAEMTDGVLIGVAAGLILFPGFLSDVAALFLLFPPTRAVVRKRLLRRAMARRGPQSYVVDGEVVDGDVVDGDLVNNEPPLVVEAQVIEQRSDPDGR